MKKVGFLMILLPIIGFAQDAQPTAENFKCQTTLSAHASFSEQSLFGVSWETTKSNEHMKKMKDPMEKMKEKVGFKESGIVQLSYAATKLENNIGLPDIDGQGVQIDFGSRTYFNRTSWKGLYLQNCLTAGKIWFKDDIPASAFTTAQHVSGFYNYISIFNPDFGYKLATAGGFSAEAAIGCIWKWELKGKADDIDNRMFDNFNPRVGVKLGYQF